MFTAVGRGGIAAWPLMLVDVKWRPNKAPQKRRSTALNIFISVLTNENTGREGEAPAELFAAANMAPLACGRPAAAR